MATKGQSFGKEKRKTPRRPILDSFSVFAVIPKKGSHRLNIHDVSEGGMGLDIDAEGESPDSLPIAKGETLDLRFYLNQTLSLALRAKVLRLETLKTGVRKVGAEFLDKNSKEFKTLKLFLQMLDSLAETGDLE